MGKRMGMMRTLLGESAPAARRARPESGDAALDVTGHSMAALREMAGLAPLAEAAEQRKSGKAGADGDEDLFEGIASDSALDMRRVMRATARRPEPAARALAEERTSPLAAAAFLESRRVSRALGETYAPLAAAKHRIPEVGKLAEALRGLISRDLLDPAHKPTPAKAVLRVVESTAAALAAFKQRATRVDGPLAGLGVETGLDLPGLHAFVESARGLVRDFTAAKVDGSAVFEFLMKYGEEPDPTSY